MDPSSPLAHKKHIVRVAIMLVLGLVILVLGRTVFVPDSYGEFGPYRAASVMEFRALPVRHGGNASCQTCHEDEHETHAGAAHSTVACELCHAPVSAHVAGEEKIADMPVRRSRELCELCHRGLAARPATFPQVDVREHVTEMGGDFTADACFECHDPHSPY